MTMATWSLKVSYYARRIGRCHGNDSKLNPESRSGQSENGNGRTPGYLKDNSGPGSGERIDDRDVARTQQKTTQEARRGLGKEGERKQRTKIEQGTEIDLPPKH